MKALRIRLQWLGFGLIASSFAGMAIAQDVFPDVPENHWAYENLAPVQGPEIRDKTGGTWVRGWSKMRYEKQPGNKGRYIVRANPGKRILGSWKQEGMEIEVGDLDFIFTTSNGTFDLQSATMGGTIEATFTRPSSNAASKTMQTANIKAGSADYSDTKSTIDVRGGVNLASNDPGSNQSMTASGSSGVINLSKPGSKGNVVQLATLAGPVVMKLNGTRRGDDGKPQKYDVNGWADRMVFNDAAHTVTFTGNVKITGDDPSLGGQISGVSKVLITFSATGEIESIDMDGDPGTTTISDKRKGGGKR